MASTQSPIPHTTQPQASGTVVIVDDDAHIRELAAVYLRKEGFDVAWAGDGLSALETIHQTKPDLVILDLMLPGKTGFDVCKELRQESNVPVIMLTARDEDVDKIVGLEIGADDYLTKPFNPRELVARVKAILRRSEPGQPKASPAEITLGRLTIDKARREVRSAGEEVTFRTKEFDLLAALAENAGIVLTREQLLDRVWGYSFYGETRTVDVHVQHVRAKLAGSGYGIQTVRGVGYKLVEDAEA
jgi:DNA-binding response OmpR family regulator